MKSYLKELCNFYWNWLVTVTFYCGLAIVLFVLALLLFSAV